MTACIIALFVMVFALAGVVSVAFLVEGKEMRRRTNALEHAVNVNAGVLHSVRNAMNNNAEILTKVARASGWTVESKDPTAPKELN